MSGKEAEYPQGRVAPGGCVTPKQVASIQEVVGEDKDLSLLDGFEDVSAENQDKIRDAVENGHVADSDWRGDIEMNRPGKTGFRVRASKKKIDAEADHETPKKTKRHRGKKGGEDTDAEQSEEPAPKKAKAASSKSKPVARESEGKPETGDKPVENQKPGRKASKPRKAEEEQKSPASTGKKRSRKAADKVEARTGRVTRSMAKAG
ncbi:predicted protein [Uncinocarpus reesii 1704]|uniref:Uncharacterized protein n=1 Tax=Uncinocarpus reesii (strain UAMH 1704) TaxID=336963 RepID=C4JYL4_UNCRE|nr:uncharacterized protein UREG_07265 [Uncinocarpus reesii 1704]EEP82400.1 predicted protein [Uncinocarpus reesii 1704]